MKKLIPIIMLFVGVGAGAGAGLFLRPAAPEVKAENAVDDVEEHDEAHDKPATSHDEKNASSAGMEYVKLPNQFVVPLVEENRISAMVVMALSVEVVQGFSESVIEKEPKLRDEFLRVLFDYATIGGFNGAFINNENLDGLRANLRDVAKAVMGPDVARDVLIFEIARQDY